MTTDRDSEAVLLPCPWCGSAPEIGKWEAAIRAGHPDATAIGCTSDLVDCPINPGHSDYTRNETIAAWNRRALIPVAGLEALVERAEDLLHKIDGFGRAYPTDIFSEPTKDEREWLHATKPGLMDRIAASMGRHVWSLIDKDISAIRTELAQLIQEAK